MSKFCDHSFTPCSGWCNPYLSLGLKLNLKKELCRKLQTIYVTFISKGLRHSNHSLNGNWVVERTEDQWPAKRARPS